MRSCRWSDGGNLQMDKILFFWHSAFFLVFFKLGKGRWPLARGPSKPQPKKINIGGINRPIVVRRMEKDKKKTRNELRGRR